MSYQFSLSHSLSAFVSQSFHLLLPSELLDEPVIVDKYTTEPLNYLSPVIEFDQAVPIVSSARPPIGGKRLITGQLCQVQLLLPGQRRHLVAQWLWRSEALPAALRPQRMAGCRRGQGAWQDQITEIAARWFSYVAASGASRSGWAGQYVSVSCQWTGDIHEGQQLYTIEYIAREPDIRSK